MRRSRLRPLLGRIRRRVARAIRPYQNLPAVLTAAYLEHNVPARCIAGSRCVFRVRLVNTGNVTWRRDPPDGHFAALGLFIDETVVATGRLTEDVAPGHGTLVAITVDLPHISGEHTFRFDMVLYNKAWFSGGLTLKVLFTAGEKTRTEELLATALRRNYWFFSPGLSVHRSRGNVAYPVFAESATGCRITDVDGREYVDLHMGWGCCLLGYGVPRIEEAIARARVGTSGVLSLTHRLEIELSEALCASFPWGDEVLFGKNGSDVTTWAVRTARVATGRKTILCSGYHGWQDWFVARQGFEATGVPSELGSHTVLLPYGDVTALEMSVAEHSADLAAIFIEPAATSVDLDDPTHVQDEPYLRRAEELARRKGALFILDEIMTGFRFRSGSAQAAYGLKPDLTCLGKALSNGMPLAALTARDQLLRRHIDRIVYCPTNKGEVHSFAAAVAALQLYKEQDVPAAIWETGERIREGVNRAGRELDLDARLVGPPYRMYLGFFGLSEAEGVRCRTLLQQELARNGLISHKGYVLPSLAHDGEAIERTIDGFSTALASIREALDYGIPTTRLDIPDVAPEGTTRSSPRPGGRKVRAPADTMRSDAALARLQAEIRERRVRLESKPSTINIELTGKCNVKPACTFCVGKNEPGYREPGHAREDQFSRYWPHLLRSRRVNDCTYGEPFLYPDFEGVIERLASSGVKFGFTTNGLLLDERRARFLVEHSEWLDMAVSVNAGTKETYFRHHGQDFDKLLENIARFVRLHESARPTERPPIILSYIVMRSNRNEVFDFLRTALRLGVRRAMLRHLFDLRVGDYSANNFGYAFVYENERLPYAEYKDIEAAVRAAPEFAEMEIYYQWNEKESFIAEQAEPGVDIPCLFPWKFLCIRPIHDIYTPCVYLKRGIASPSRATVEEVWNGDVMVQLRTSLAASEIPDFCMTYGDNCPLVLERRHQTQGTDLVQVQLTNP
jgi:glutamate-1-semialdehyde 2,1-aminomutase